MLIHFAIIFALMPVVGYIYILRTKNHFNVVMSCYDEYLSRLAFTVSYPLLRTILLPPSMLLVKYCCQRIVILISVEPGTQLLG